LANCFEHPLCCVTSLFGQANFRYVRTVATSVECSALVDNATNDLHNLWSIRCNIVHLIFFPNSSRFPVKRPRLRQFWPPWHSLVPCLSHHKLYLVRSSEKKKTKWHVLKVSKSDQLRIVITVIILYLFNSFQLFGGCYTWSVTMWYGERHSAVWKSPSKRWPWRLQLDCRWGQTPQTIIQT
jgi:hypothetical protein